MGLSGAPLTIQWGTLAAYARLWEQAAVRNPYQSPGWLRAMARAYGFPLRFALWGDAGVPFVVVPGRFHRGPRRWVSLPFSDRSGVVRRSSGPEHLLPEEFEALQKALASQTPRWELRNLLAPTSEAPAPTYGNFVVPLDPGQEPRRAMKDTIRRNVKKARRAGVEIRRFQSLEALWIFYRLYGLTHRRHGVPVQPWAWFRALWEEVIRRDQGFLTLALYEGRVVAGALFLTDGHTVVYKYGATDYRFQRLRPNDLLFYEEIQRAWRAGCRAFDLGRVGPGEEGLKTYKRKWGAREIPLYYTSGNHRMTWEPPAEASPWYHRAARVLRRAPTALLRGIGENLYAYLA